MCEETKFSNLFLLLDANGLLKSLAKIDGSENYFYLNLKLMSQQLFGTDC